MKNTATEDLSGDKLNSLIESIDELFAEMDDNENET